MVPQGGGVSNSQPEESKEARVVVPSAEELRLKKELEVSEGKLKEGNEKANIEYIQKVQDLLLSHRKTESAEVDSDRLQPIAPVPAYQEEVAIESLSKVLNDSSFKTFRENNPEVIYGDIVTDIFKVKLKELSQNPDPIRHAQILDTVQYFPNEPTSGSFTVGESDAKEKRPPVLLGQWVGEDAEDNERSILREIVELTHILDANLLERVTEDPDKAIDQLNRAQSILENKIASLNEQRKKDNDYLIERLNASAHGVTLKDGDILETLQVIAERMEANNFDPTKEQLDIIKLSVERFKEKLIAEEGEEKIEQAVCKFQKLIDEDKKVAETLLVNAEDIQLFIDGKKVYGFERQMTNFSKVLIDQLARVVAKADAAKKVHPELCVKYNEIKGICEDIKTEIEEQFSSFNQGVEYQDEKSHNARGFDFNQ